MLPHNNIFILNIYHRAMECCESLQMNNNKILYKPINTKSRSIYKTPSSPLCLYLIPRVSSSSSPRLLHVSSLPLPLLLLISSSFPPFLLLLERKWTSHRTKQYPSRATPFSLWWRRANLEAASECLFNGVTLPSQVCERMLRLTIRHN